MSAKRVVLVFLLSSVSFFGNTQALLPGFNEQVIATDLRLPNGIAFDQRGVGYIWEMEGQVKVLDTNDLVLETPLIDLTEEVAKWLDNGLLGFTLHPEYPTIPYIYLLYTVDWHHYENFGTPDYNAEVTIKKTATFGRITRYTADPSSDFKTIIPESRKVLIGEKPENGFPILYDSHGVGSLVFSDDGSLLASSGDAASSISEDIGSNSTSYYEKAIERGIITPSQNVGAFRAQMLSTLAGKIIRIDPSDGEGILSNPFFDQNNPKSNQSKIWALGLRNGFRFSIKPNSGSHFTDSGKPGKLLVGDVGNNAWEELNVINDGAANLGWPIYEGFFKSPYNDYQVFNEEVVNPYGDLDNCDKFMTFHKLLVDDNLEKKKSVINPCKTTELLPSNITHLHHRPILSYRNEEKDSLPKAFYPDYDEIDQAISLSISDLGLEAFEGTANVGGLFYEHKHFPAEFNGKYFMMDFSGWIKTLEFDDQDKVVSIEDFYDGGEKFVHISSNPKNGSLYIVSTSGEIIKIAYGGNLPPVINVKSSQLYGPTPLTVHWDASLSKDEDANLTYEWDFGDGVNASDMIVSHSFEVSNSSVKNFEVSLKVTDSQGASSKEKFLVSVNNTPPDVMILSPEQSANYPIDHSHFVRLEGTANDLEDGVSGLEFEWETFLHHETHFHEDQIFEGNDAYIITNPINCDVDKYWFRARLKVTDSHGLSSEKEVEIFPNCNSSETISAELISRIESREVVINSVINNLQLAKIIEIQRRVDDGHFSPIEDVDVFLLSNLESFSYVDKNPMNGVLTYRLKFLQENGDWFYSNSSSVNYPRIEKSIVHPNPSVGLLTIVIDKVYVAEISIEIFDFFGKKFLSKSYPSIVDKPFSTEIDASFLAEGSYIVRITKGEQIFQEKVLILK